MRLSAFWNIKNIVEVRCDACFSSVQREAKHIKNQKIYHFQIDNETLQGKDNNRHLIQECFVKRHAWKKNITQKINPLIDMDTCGSHKDELRN